MNTRQRFSNEDGSGSSVRHIPISDNRSSGAVLGHQFDGIPDGAKVRLVPVGDTT